MKISTHRYLVFGVAVKNLRSCTFTPPYSMIYDYKQKFYLDIKISFSRVVYIRNATEIFL